MKASQREFPASPVVPTIRTKLGETSDLDDPHRPAPWIVLKPDGLARAGDSGRSTTPSDGQRPQTRTGIAGLRFRTIHTPWRRASSTNRMDLQTRVIPDDPHRLATSIVHKPAGRHTLRPILDDRLRLAKRTVHKTGGPASPDSDSDHPHRPATRIRYKPDRLARAEDSGRSITPSDGQRPETGRPASPGLVSGRFTPTGDEPRPQTGGPAHPASDSGRSSSTGEADRPESGEVATGRGLGRSRP
jgi:hypothetical protein